MPPPPPVPSPPPRHRFLVSVAAAASDGVVLAPGGDEQAGGLVTEYLRAGPPDQLVVVPLPSSVIGWRAGENVTAVVSQRYVV